MANGAYVPADTPNVVAINTPHVFHGTNTDVNVPPSSSARERFLACNFFNLNASANMRDGTMIEIYCSEQVKFVPIHDTITDAISEPVRFANFNITLINAASIPEYSSTPPKVIATSVSEMV